VARRSPGRGDKFYPLEGVLNRFPWTVRRLPKGRKPGTPPTLKIAAPVEPVTERPAPNLRALRKQLESEFKEMFSCRASAESFARMASEYRDRADEHSKTIDELLSRLGV
jgi:hypothetical protein